MPFLETPRLNLHYRNAGEGPTPLVFLHGNYASSRWWEPMLQNLPEGYRGLAPDLRGCGSKQEYSSRSQAVIRDISILDLVEDLEAFLAELELARIVLVGHSLGGLIGTSFSIRHPERVLALVLEDTGPAWGISLGSVTTPLLLPLEIKNRRMLRSALRRAGVPRRGALAEALLEDALSAPRGLYYQFSRAAAAWKEGDALERIIAPTLLLWGENDRVMPKRYAKAYLERIPQSELVIIPGVGHSPHLENSIEVGKAMSGFLEKRIPAPENIVSAKPRRRGILNRRNTIDQKKG